MAEEDLLELGHRLRHEYGLFQFKEACEELAAVTPGAGWDMRRIYFGPAAPVPLDAEAANLVQKILEMGAEEAFWRGYSIGASVEGYLNSKAEHLADRALRKVNAAHGGNAKGDRLAAFWSALEPVARAEGLFTPSELFFGHPFKDHVSPALSAAGIKVSDRTNKVEYTLQIKGTRARVKVRLSTLRRKLQAWRKGCPQDSE